MTSGFETVGPFGRTVEVATTTLVRSSDANVDRSRAHLERIRLCVSETELRIVRSREIIARTDRLMGALHRFMEF